MYCLQEVWKGESETDEEIKVRKIAKKWRGKNGKQKKR